MILSDGEIKHAIKTGQISISPPPEDDQYGPSSLDLHIGEEFREWDPAVLKMPGFEPVVRLSEYKHSVLTHFLREVHKQEDGTILLPPKGFVLALTREVVTLPIESRIAARVEGRSSLARSGLMVHLTAPTIHCSFTGQITLEILNQGVFTFRLTPNVDRICQIIFERLGKEPEDALDSTFQGQKSLRHDS